MFEAGNNPDGLTVAHAGVTTKAGARNDRPRCPCENTMDISTSNPDNLQSDQGCKHSTCQLCSNVSQQTDESGQSTSCCETEKCYDITQENILLKQDDTVLKHLLQWKRDGDKPG